MRNGYMLQPNGKYYTGEWKNDSLKKTISTGKYQPGDAGTCYMKGLAFYTYKKYTDAQLNFGKAIEKGYKDDSAYLYRAASFLNNNRNDSAITWLNRYLAKKAKDKTALLYRARAYKAMKDTAASIKDYTAIIAIDAKYADAYWERGYIAYYQKRYQDAIDDFTRCIASLPKETKGDNVYYYRGYAYRDMGNKKAEMCADLQKAKELGNKNAAAAVSMYCAAAPAAN
jgi:tetratricopeptide (TPR) repeat protein